MNTADHVGRLLSVLGVERFQRLGSIVNAVQQHGSLNKATTALGISYRQAWGLVRQAEAEAGAPLLSRRVGGTEGGGAALTALAHDLLTRWQQLRQQVAGMMVSAGTAEGRPVLLASTIGPVEVGLLDSLEGAFHAATGLWVRHIAAGTGQALEIARAGRVDLVLVHAPAEEERFLAEGWGRSRHPMMRNDFVLCGPDPDPAGVRGADTAAEAFRRMAAAQALFLSRGDRSGTHLKEVALWAAAGVSPCGDWYRTFDRGAQGSGVTLREAERVGAYTLVDRATISTHRPAHARVLFEGDPILENCFSLITLSEERFPAANHEGADQFVAWASGPSGQEAISASHLFVPIS